MNDDYTLSERTYDARGGSASLSHWLQQVLETAPQEKILDDPENENENENNLSLLFQSNYHLHFYQQLPNFIMALLTHDAQTSVHHAPLLYHLAGCRECRHSYIDLYDAMRFAVNPQGPRPLLGQGTRTLSATPHRMLGHLCKSLINQAEAILHESRHNHTDNDVAARSLLQLALTVSAHIGQGSVRREALQDLVHVATLFDGPSAPKQDDPDAYVYTPVLTGAGSLRRGKVVRRSDTLAARSGSQEPFVINLLSQSLEGTIVQREQTLELHLQDLNPSLRGRYVTVSVLLGSLIEPVRWIGGNPRAIRSATPVDDAGTLVTPLGQTDLQMNNIEERNLLEAMFMFLEVRAID